MNVLTTTMEEKNFSREWTEMAEFSNSFKKVVGSSLIECLYGLTMLHCNSEIMQDL
jgi:hypothetical protein